MVQKSADSSFDCDKVLQDGHVYCTFQPALNTHYPFQLALMIGIASFNHWYKPSRTRKD